MTIKTTDVKQVGDKLDLLLKSIKNRYRIEDGSLAFEERENVPRDVCESLIISAEAKGKLYCGRLTINLHASRVRLGLRSFSFLDVTIPRRDLRER